jgi:hypothetical protein
MGHKPGWAVDEASMTGWQENGPAGPNDEKGEIFHSRRSTMRRGRGRNTNHRKDR